APAKSRQTETGQTGTRYAEICGAARAADRALLLADALYAPEKIAYAIDRYTNEVNRLFGVMNTRLATNEFLAGRYSIADMAWVGCGSLSAWGRSFRNSHSSSAGSRPFARGRRSNALLRSGSKRRPPST